MSEAIGPGSAVVAVDTLGAPPGTVAFVLEVHPEISGLCTTCEKPGGILILNIRNRWGGHAWCPYHWRPYQGPEDRKREVSEPADPRELV